MSVIYANPQLLFKRSHVTLKIWRICSILYNLELKELVHVILLITFFFKKRCFFGFSSIQVLVTVHIYYFSRLEEGYLGFLQLPFDLSAVL